MSFKLRAEGGTRMADRDEVRRALSVLVDPGQTFELRGLPSGRSRICRGDDPDSAVEAAWDLSDGQVYYTLNPLRAGLDGAAKVADVLAYRWLLIDSDPDRPADTSATDVEKSAAVDQCCRIAEHLLVRGWPDPVWIDSGNGGHLLYRVDLPADRLAQQLLKGVMAALGDRFDGVGASVDRKVHNASRISKLPGTWARKGVHTEERPHRMARLIDVPPMLEVVSVDLLREMAGGADTNAKGGMHGDNHSAPSANGHTANPWGVKAAPRGLDGYVKSAIGAECNRVAMTAAGDRNNALNTAAFNLGTMDSWPEMNRADAQRSLWEAARHAGLDRDPGCGEQGIGKTILSGWSAGAVSPRARPAQVAGARPRPLPVGDDERLTIGMEEIDNEVVGWIWENRIARKFIAIFAGKTSAAKSFVTCDVAARLSRGECPPFSALRPRAPLRTLFISEDPLGAMLVPRLRELKANERMIRFMKWRAMAGFVLSDAGTLDRLRKEHPFDLLVIDPPSNFLGGTDEHKNAEVRSMLMNLVVWLEENDVACILITHVNKQVGKGLDAVERIIGSVAWASVARITVAFAADPDDDSRMVCGGTKNNLGGKAEALSYRVARTDDLAMIEWIGVSETTIEDAMNKVKKKTRGVCAVEWLTERFRERLEWPSEDLKRAAAEFGLSKNALWSDEVNALPIAKRRRADANGEANWFWIAKNGWPPPEAGGIDGNVGNLGNVVPQDDDTQRVD